MCDIRVSFCKDQLILCNNKCQQSNYKLKEAGRNLWIWPIRRDLTTIKISVQSIVQFFSPDHHGQNCTNSFSKLLACTPIFTIQQQFEHTHTHNYNMTSCTHTSYAIHVQQQVYTHRHYDWLHLEMTLSCYVLIGQDCSAQSSIYGRRLPCPRVCLVSWHELSEYTGMSPGGKSWFPSTVGRRSFSRHMDSRSHWGWPRLVTAEPTNQQAVCFLCNLFFLAPTVTHLS